MPDKVSQALNIHCSVIYCPFFINRSGEVFVDMAYFFPKPPGANIFQYNTLLVLGIFSILNKGMNISRLERQEAYLCLSLSLYYFLKHSFIPFTHPYLHWVLLLAWLLHESLQLYYTISDLVGPTTALRNSFLLASLCSVIQCKDMETAFWVTCSKLPADEVLTASKTLICIWASLALAPALALYF